ncbi:hypothetical protein E4U53_003477 [Claviceps sorghi]|nr:hypothetical protein E4U53_003477 [Claviceps sorghi]
MAAVPKVRAGPEPVGAKIDKKLYSGQISRWHHDGEHEVSSATGYWFSGGCADREQRCERDRGREGEGESKADGKDSNMAHPVQVESATAEITLARVALGSAMPGRASETSCATTNVDASLSHKDMTGRTARPSPSWDVAV